MGWRLKSFFNFNFIASEMNDFRYETVSGKNILHLKIYYNREKTLFEIVEKAT